VALVAEAVAVDLAVDEEVVVVMVDAVIAGEFFSLIYLLSRLLTIGPDMVVVRVVAGKHSFLAPFDLLFQSPRLIIDSRYGGGGGYQGGGGYSGGGGYQGGGGGYGGGMCQISTNTHDPKIY